jgi:hypothetical protein
VKNLRSVFFLSAIIIFALSACKKINEPTDLGSDLIPPIDNVNTFEISLNTVTDNKLMTDSTRVGYSDLLALGDVNDPEFGNVHANLAFAVTPTILGSYPFVNRDSVTIDSVILSLSYRGAWGDTVGNGIQTLRVYEVAQNSGFRDDTTYKYADPTSDFAANPGGTTGSELGSKTFAIKNLKDSVTIIRRRDTSKVANVVRIPLSNSLGERFKQYDTTSQANSGGYHLDSTGGSIFRKLFRGLAIKADNSGNALSYFSLSDVTKTRLIVYFRVVKNGVVDTTSLAFTHVSNGRANYIKQTAGNQWASYLNNGNNSDDKLYLQVAPSGSYASVLIPGLSTLQNSVIHRAELIANVLPSSQNTIFAPPAFLFLDRTNKSPVDTAFLFDNDITINGDLSWNLGNFGGSLNNDAYKFNITRYVQGIVTRGNSNDTLRLYAPHRPIVYSTVLGGKVQGPVFNRIGTGRVVLGGGTFTDPSKQLRLRVVYSKL